MSNPEEWKYDINRPFEIDQQISAMRENVATRTRNLQLKQMLVSGGMFVLGGAILAAMVFASGGTGLLGGGVAQAVIGGGVIAGGAISNIIFAKEIKKLEMDEQFLEARLKGEVGNRYWQHYQNNVHSRGEAPTFDPGLHGAPPPDAGNSQGL